MLESKINSQGGSFKLFVDWTALLIYTWDGSKQPLHPGINYGELLMSTLQYGDPKRSYFDVLHY